MRALLIDPFSQIVSEVEYSGKLDDIYRLTRCSIVEATYADNVQTLYVDEEGLFKSLPFFRICGNPQPLAGCGLVVGCDKHGNDIEPKITLAELTEAVWFL